MCKMNRINNWIIKQDSPSYDEITVDEEWFCDYEEL